MRKTNTEDNVYPVVISGELTIDSQGRIWRLARRTGNRWNRGTKTIPCLRVRAENALSNGYLQIRAMFNWKRHNALAHRLVWRHFYGLIPKGLLIDHKNCKKADNRPENLQLVSESESLRHRPTFNQRGERNHRCKLSNAQVAEIRKRRSEGESLSSLATGFGVTFQTISRIALHQRR